LYQRVEQWPPSEVDGIKVEAEKLSCHDVRNLTLVHFNGITAGRAVMFFARSPHVGMPVSV
jgi:hypothetical protein